MSEIIQITFLLILNCMFVLSYASQNLPPGVCEETKSNPTKPVYVAPVDYDDIDNYEDEEFISKEENKVKLVCCKGYVEVASDSLSKLHGGIHCEPKCEPPCVRGHCVAPNTCRCAIGYTSSLNGTCVPRCRNKCPEGEVCIAPNQCAPNATNATMCGGMLCIQGRCTRNHECECDLGYLRKYNRSQQRIECQPLCSNCQHGKCISPRTCICNEGYTKADDKCVPKCSMKCINADCTAPDTCTCHLGYAKHFNSTNVCVKPCGLECNKHGICESDHLCRCNHGYKHPPKDKLRCIPDCNEECDANSMCVEPGKCECKEGYSKQVDVCKPVCHIPCLNGYCILPDTCECDAGYKLQNGSCILDESQRESHVSVGTTTIGKRKMTSHTSNTTTIYGNTTTDIIPDEVLSLYNIAIWCNLTLLHTTTDLEDFSYVFDPANYDAGEDIFSCATLRRCSIRCSPEYEQALRHEGYIQCNLTYDTDQGSVYCYAVNLTRYFLDNNNLHKMPKYQTCSPTIISNSSNMLTFATSTYFKYTKEGERSPDIKCSYCPCADKNKVYLTSDMQIDANVCPCLQEKGSAVEYHHYQYRYLTIFLLSLLLIIAVCVFIALWKQRKVSYYVRKTEPCEYTNKVFNELSTRNLHSDRLIVDQDEREFDNIPI